MKNNRYNCTAECIAVKNDEVYFATREMNLILKADINSLTVEVFCEIPEEDKFTERLYHGIYIEDEKMILVPYNAKKIWIYDFSKKIWNGIEIGKYVNPDMEGKFVGGALINGKAYLFGYNYHGILAVDVNTARVCNLLELEDDNNYSFWGQSTAIVDNKLYVANRLRNEVICINLTDGNYEKIWLKGMSTGNFTIDGISHDGEKFYIMPHHGNFFYEWTPYNESIKKYIDSFYDSNESFFNGIVATNRIILFFSAKEKSYVFNRIEEDKSYILNENVYYAKKIENIGLFMCKKGKIEIYDLLLNRTKKIIETFVDVDTYEKYLDGVNLGNLILKENMLGLNEFLLVVTNN